MAHKAYNTGSVEYQYSLKSKKWEFRTPSFVTLVACHGNEQAHKVAAQVTGSLKRGKSIDKLDELARAGVNRIIGHTRFSF